LVVWRSKYSLGVDKEFWKSEMLLSSSFFVLASKMFCWC
jgi:hypothetical protein